LQFYIGQAVALGADDLAVSGNEQGESGDVLLRHFRLDVGVEGVGGQGVAHRGEYEQNCDGTISKAS
jgi:hypothetical protein